MTTKSKIKATFTSNVRGVLWQWERRKRAPGLNMKPISYQAVWVWIFFLVVVKILQSTCQRHTIFMWGGSEQSFPFLLHQKQLWYLAVMVFLLLFIPVTGLPVQQIICLSSYHHHGLHPGKSAVLHFVWLFGGLVIDGLTTQLKTEKEKQYKCFLHLYVSGYGWISPGSSLVLLKKSYQNLPSTMTYATALITQFCH